MWSQNWQVYHKLLMPTLVTEFDLDSNVGQTNWSSYDMAKRADDFYTSIGMPAMTKTFWEKSVFEKSSGNSKEKCHGTAANMFEQDDYRLKLIIFMFFSSKIFNYNYIFKNDRMLCSTYNR